MKLVAPDIHGEHGCGAPFQADLREPARGGAQVQHGAALDRYRPQAQGVIELHAAAPHPRMGGGAGEHRVLVEHVGGLGDHLAVGGDRSGLDGGAGLGAAVEQPSRHQEQVGALAGH